MSKKGKEKNDENMTEIPLLEEVNELLHKERNLMNLKLIEQHVEAKEWKEKYETLVEKISGDALNQEKIKAYEVAAEVSTAPRLNTWRNNIEKQLYLLPSSNMPWYLDVSNVSLGVNDIHRILMYPKTNNYKLITVFNFHNCEIDDSCAQLFPHMLRYPNIAAIDFSCNNVSETFHKSLLGAVEVRYSVFNCHAAVNFNTWIVVVDETIKASIFIAAWQYAISKFSIGKFPSSPVEFSVGTHCFTY